jgi:CBS domain-containing protein
MVPTTPVRVVMAVPVVSIDPTATLRAAATLMDDEEIGALTVPSLDGPGGLLSERDIVRALGTGADPDTATVATAMTADPVWVEAETPLDAVLDLMFETGVRHVPVVAGREVIGMVSMRDVLDTVRTERAGEG